MPKRKPLELRIKHGDRITAFAFSPSIPPPLKGQTLTYYGEKFIVTKSELLPRGSWPCYRIKVEAKRA